MKRIAVLTLLISIAFTSAAFACHFDRFQPRADCEGWCVDGSIWSTRDWADLSWTVTLRDGDGAVVATFTGSDHLVLPGDSVFSVCDSWGMELCGDFTAEGSFYVIADGGDNDTETFSIAFTCICDEPNGCTGTPGYWKNHGDAWPVSSLTVGGVSYTKAQLMVIFDMPTKGDLTIKLFHHLVAAKLNVLNGAGGDPSADIDAADAWLAAHGLYSSPTGELKDECNDLKNALVDYNEGHPCGDDPGILGVSGAPMAAPAPPEQAKTWGMIKKIYQ